MSKRILIGATIFALLIASSITAPANAGSNSSQIMFFIKGDTIQYLVIQGTNQNNQQVTWKWADAWNQHWSTGAYVLTTQGWWWKGDVQLSFSGTKIGKKYCHIENLKISSSAYTVVAYIPELGTCTGEAGNVGTPNWVKMALRYYLGDDAPALLDTASKLDNAQECFYGIAEGLAQGNKTLYVLWKCRGSASDVIVEILKKHGVSIR